MLLREVAENALRRWDALERSNGAEPVIDFDCALIEPPSGAYENRLDALTDLTKLRDEAAAAGLHAIRCDLDAHVTYLAALAGQQFALGEYISRTQGCATTGWSQDYIDHRKALAQDALATLGVDWSTDTKRALAVIEEQISPDEVGAAIKECATKYEPIVRSLVSTDAEFTITIDNVNLDAYWSYWLDGAGTDARLRINRRNAHFSRIDVYRFALHEVLGHALQYASLTARGASNDTDWLRILAVHCPHQVLFEGLAQVLPWFVSPSDPLVTARLRLDHYLQLVNARIHLLVSNGASITECLSSALAYAPWLSTNDILRELRDRSTNPQLRSYLWAYPAGIDWFVQLTEAGGTVAVEVFREAYKRPLTPHELQQLWPAGPVAGGNQQALRLRHSHVG